MISHNASLCHRGLSQRRRPFQVRVETTLDPYRHFVKLSGLFHFDLLNLPVGVRRWYHVREETRDTFALAGAIGANLIVRPTNWIGNETPNPARTQSRIEEATHETVHNR